MEKTIEIKMDDRERCSDMYRALGFFDDVLLSIDRLAVGDYEVNKTLLFERKTLPDFAASLLDGRLFNQACKLAATPQRGVIIIEGCSTDLVDTRVRREALQGALISLNISFDIPVLRSKNCDETARLIRYAALQCSQAITGAVPRKPSRPRGKRRLQLHILQGLPGVGPARASCLLENFGSVEAVFSADPERIAKIQGIGKETANKIRWAVSDDCAGYRVC